MEDHTTNETAQEIPYGYCKCGCGNPTPITKWSDKRTGAIKGQPARFISNHHRKNHSTSGPNPSGLCKCGCGQLAPIAKDTNNGKGHIQGFPVSFICGHHRRRSVTERFWEKVDKHGPVHPVLGTECWDWKAHIKDNGYGWFGVGPGPYSIHAHRFSYELHCGHIPDELWVLHKCDRRCCVRPEHLWLGTNLDNISDMYEKGRNNPPKGEQSHFARFTDEQVKVIRQQYATGQYQYKELANMYGVTGCTISCIVKRKSWKHID